MKQGLFSLFKLSHRIMVCCGLFLFGGISCQWLEGPSENYVFIFVEELGFDAVSCGREREYAVGSGFHTLCEDSVLFSHSYTNSPLSPVALASFFTGASPSQHEVGGGGRDFLPSEWKTLTEVAWEKGLHTWMFSGGPPIFRKSGFSQGFEVFEDNLAVNQGRLFRPFSESLKFFFKLLGDAKKPGFFAVFYLPDLVFDEFETIDEQGLPREKSYEGQLEEINHGLGVLFRYLKREKLWSPTHVVVAGLNGRPRWERPGEILATNLYSERVHTSLFIKPARGRGRDEPKTWKVNQKVSLVDLGATYFDWMGAPLKASPSPLRSLSLKDVLIEPPRKAAAYRPIEVLSSWGAWRGQGNTRRSLRVGEQFYLFDSPPVVYNTLVDRLERSSVSSFEDQDFLPIEQWDRVYGGADLELWTGLDEIFREKLEWARDLFGSKDVRDQIELMELRRFIQRLEGDDRQFAGWVAQWALDSENWELLLELGDRFSRPYWSFVAASHLGRRLPDVSSLDCGELFSDFKGWSRRITYKDCRDDVFVDLMNWVLESDSRRKGLALETFLTNYHTSRNSKKIAEMNYLKGLSWDVPLSEPRGPSVSELFLGLPENRTRSRQIQSRLRTM